MTLKIFRARSSTNERYGNTSNFLKRSREAKGQDKKSENIENGSQ
jgi:hypothetical protein